jgi:hypothetical protein
MQNKWMWLAVLFQFLMLVRVDAATDGISVWTRRAGDYRDGGEPGRAAEKRLLIKEAKTSERKLFDVHYGKSARYRAVNLNDLIRSHDPGASADLVILHFKNRMLIPVSKDMLMERGGDKALWLATEIFDDQAGGWRSKFPEVARPDERYRDPMPIRFDGHKLVVGKQWRTPRSGVKDAFVAWRHADTLVGIEFANERSYSRQFLPVKQQRPQDTAGWEIYLTRCQFCHSVRQVGARYGWDFVTPLPIYEKRSVESLFLHVQVEKQDAMQMGTRMPHQPDFSPREAEELWSWLRSVAKSSLRTYEP